MAKTYLEPAGDLVLVLDKPRTSTIDGIEMPDNERQQEMAFGVVVSVGPRCLAIYSPTGEYCPATKPQDIVCYGPYAGKTTVIEGVQFRLLREGQIEGYVRQSQ